MTIPPLTDDQRRRARATAAEARRRRAEIKRGLADGTRPLAEVLAQADTDPVVAQMRVADLLRALPRIGSVRAARAMDRLDIAANRRLRGLGRHQAAALVAEFSDRVGSRRPATAGEQTGNQAGERAGGGR